MSTTIGNLAVILSANAAGFTQGFAAAQKTAGSFIGTLGTMAKTAGGIVGIGSAVSLVTTAFKGFTGAEESRITFQALLGSAENAKAFKSELKDFGDTTSFGDGVGAAAKELLKFNFSQESIIPTLKQLGDIAAGVNVPLEELANVVGKSGYRANISGKQLIALTEMGVPIVQELSKTMGLSQNAISQLAEQGGIKFDDLMGAMRSATSEGGNFFGMMNARANTTNGLIGRIVDQTGDVIGKMGSVLGDRISAMFGVKSGMNSIFDWLQEVEEGVKNMGPWFDNIILAVQTVGDVFTTVWTGASAVFSAAWTMISEGFGVLSDSVGGFREIFIDAMLSVRFVFQNFGAISELLFEKFKLGLALLGNDVWHLFTVNIPELLGWFSRNWKQVFTDMYEMTITIFTNIGKNIWNFFKNIPGLIAGTVAFEDIWTPLTDGFKTSITESLDFTAREFTTFEKEQMAKISALDAVLGAKKDTFFADEKNKLRGTGFFEGMFNSMKPGPGVGKPGTLGELAAKGGDKGKAVTYTGAFEAGSKEAYNILVRARDVSLAPANRTAKAVEKSEGWLKQIAGDLKSKASETVPVWEAPD